MWQFEASFCLPFLERKWVEQSMDASSWNLITCWWKQMEYLSLDCMCWYEVRKSWLLKDDRKDIHAKPWVDVSFYNLWMFVGLYRSPQLLPLHILLEQKQWCELWALKKKYRIISHDRFEIVENLSDITTYFERILKNPFTHGPFLTSSTTLLEPVPGL